MNSAKHRDGFTLLELLVALTICVFIGIGAHAMLQSVIKAQDIAKSHSQQLAQLQKAMWVITEDIEQMNPGTLAIPSGTYAAGFVRRGWSNPLGLPRSDLMQVSYQLDGTTLKRQYWSAEEKYPAPQTQLLLDNISSFGIVLLSPLEVEITFTSETYGPLRRVIEIPES